LGEHSYQSLAYTSLLVFYRVPLSSAWLLEIEQRYRIQIHHARHFETWFACFVSVLSGNHSHLLASNNNQECGSYSRALCFGSLTWSEHSCDMRQLFGDTSCQLSALQHRHKLTQSSDRLKSSSKRLQRASENQARTRRSLKVRSRRIRH